MTGMCNDVLHCDASFIVRKWKEYVMEQPLDACIANDSHVSFVLIFSMSDAQDRVLDLVFYIGCKNLAVGVVLGN